ncbi:MAG TPA: hypothetical protein VIK59_09860 [Verrucomicrobiae bacterium]
MSFKTEMNFFFVRNCFSETQRERVKVSSAYQRAMDNNDAIEAQEIATQIQEGKEIHLPVPASTEAPPQFRWK